MGMYNAGGSGNFRVPDRDLYRRMLSTFGSVHNGFLKNRFVVRSSRDLRLQQPHYTSLKNINPTFVNHLSHADGICSHYLRRGMIKPNKTQMSAGAFSGDARWLFLGTVTGEIALWEADTLKVHKVVSIPAHKVFSGEDVIDSVSITAMSYSNNLLVTGDASGLIHFCDETLREIRKIPDAHKGPIRSISFSPFDLKIVSASDDSNLHVWSHGNTTPEVTLSGHLADIKACDWHPFRSLIASGSRDCTIKLWDPRQNACLSSLTNHKKQVNCLAWNKNGNWLATGSKDGLCKIFDIRTLRELETLRGHNSDVTSVNWHPQNENLLSSGGYNGSLIHWIANHTQTPHTVIADAHRQSIDILTYHPAGHCLATASHDGILKFWCREPPGSTLENDFSKEFQDNPVVAYGPVQAGANNVVPIYVPPQLANPMERGPQMGNNPSSGAPRGAMGGGRGGAMRKRGREN